MKEDCYNKLMSIILHYLWKAFFRKKVGLPQIRWLITFLGTYVIASREINIKKIFCGYSDEVTILTHETHSVLIKIANWVLKNRGSGPGSFPTLWNRVSTLWWMTLLDEILKNISAKCTR